MRIRFDKAAGAKIAKKIETIGTHPLSRKETDELGTRLIDEMKNLIAKGISPISGNGRFPAYKNPKSYPGDRKPKSPVNLKLTGEFLKALTHRVLNTRQGSQIEIGYFSGNQEKKELGHRAGVNSQPKRPTLPLPKHGEEFARSIRDVYLQFINGALNKKTRT